jgi:hypothetical protein
MNILKILKNMNTVDVVAYVLYLSAAYRYFFIDDGLATLYITTLALFFFGISFIVSAIEKTKVVINVTTSETVLITSGKATIQE